jgi:hypothetical protein
MVAYIEGSEKVLRDSQYFSQRHKEREEHEEEGKKRFLSVILS